MIKQKETIEKCGAHVLLVAYDEPSLLATKLMRGLEVPYELLLDSSRSAYRDWGMGRTTLSRSLFDPRLGFRYLRLLLRGEPFLGMAPDMLQLGGDFIVDRQGRIFFAHTMRNNGDRVAVPRLLEALQHCSGAAPVPA